MLRMMLKRLHQSCQELQEGQDQRKKGRTAMDLNEIWRMYHDSIEINGISLSMLVRSKSKDRHGGANESTSTHWLKKAMKMYNKRLYMSFLGAKDLNLVTDASRHGVFDVLVSVCYNHVSDVAGFPPCQSLRSAKFIKPGEILCESPVEKLLAEGARTRLSGYRLLQALSHQIELLTNDRLKLASYLVPDSMSSALKPLSSSVTRVVRGTSVRIVAADGEASPSVNLLDLLELPILIIGMDQGSSGCAAMAFLQDATVMMCHCYWDGFHRLIRDMKLAVSNSPAQTKQHLGQGQLCGSYIYCLNYKPFGKAGFHEDKKDLLSSFMETETQD